MVSKSHSAHLCFEPKEHRKLASAGLEFLRPGLGAMFLIIEFQCHSVQSWKRGSGWRGLGWKGVGNDSAGGAVLKQVPGSTANRARLRVWHDLSMVYDPNGLNLKENIKKQNCCRLFNSGRTNIHDQRCSFLNFQPRLVLFQKT